MVASQVCFPGNMVVIRTSSLPEVYASLCSSSLSPSFSLTPPSSLSPNDLMFCRLFSVSESTAEVG